MPFHCGRISFCSRFQDFRRHFYCIFSVILRALPTIYSLSPLKLADLSPPLATDPFAVTRLLYVAPGKKSVLPSTPLNYPIARIRAVGSQELTKSTWHNVPGLLDPQCASPQGQKVNPTANPAGNAGCRPPRSWSPPRASALLELWLGMELMFQEYSIIC